MTDGQRAPTPEDTIQRRSHWAAFIFVVLAADIAVLVNETRHGANWVAYWWIVIVTIAVCTAWVQFAEQRKEAWGDKKTAMWVWHWFTGAPLILFDDPKLPWWRDIWACRPWLDTTPAQEAPTVRRITVGAMRTLAVAALIVLEYKRSGAPHGTGPRALATWGIGGTLALAAFIVGMACVAVRKAMDRWWITPLHLALQQLSGTAEKTRWPVDKRPRSWIHVTRAWENGKRGLRFKLPPMFNSGNQGLRDAFLATALDVADLSPADIDPVWNTDGRRKTLTLKPAKRMPGRVLLSTQSVQDAVTAVKDRWGYLVGFTNGWAPVTQSLEDDAPHILIAGPTKTGKSQLVKVILWQLLTKLADRGKPQVFVLDIKGYSHLDFEGRPGVTYARTPAEINTALLGVIALAHERGGEALTAKQAGRDPGFAPVFVVFEDIGAAMSKLSKPAKEAWDDILSTGRGVSVHGFALPQRPDVQYLGPGSIRDNLGNRMLMSGHGDSARKMVAQDVVYETPAQKRGRFVVLDGLVGIHTQGILDDTGIIEAELDHLLGRGEVPADQRYTPADDTGYDHPLRGIGPQQEQAIGDEEKHEQAVTGVGHRSASQQAAQATVGEHRHGYQSPQQQSSTDPDDRDEHGDGVGGDGQGGGFHAPIIQHSSYDGKGESAPDQHKHAPEDPKLVPGGATDVAPTLGAASSNGHGRRLGPPMATSAVPGDAGVMATPPQPLSHPTDGPAPLPSAVPGDAGVMATPPQPQPPATAPSTPKPHSPSLSRLRVPEVGVGGMGNGGGGTAGVGGPDPVTLSEAYARDPGVFGGVKFGTVETARKRARREGRWWVPVVATRPARGGMVAELYDMVELGRWWDSLPRSLANRPKDWLVYYIVPGGRGAVRVGADVKVGFTGDLDHRCKTLAERREHVVKLERFTSRTDARARETYLHDRYAAVRKSDDPDYEVFEIRGVLARDLADLLVVEERTG